MSLAAVTWAPLAGGQLTGKYSGVASETRRYAEAGLSEQRRRVSDAVVGIAREIGRSPAQVALNWVHQRGGEGGIPIVGARTAAQMRENLASLDVALAPEHLQQLDEISAIPLGFPHSFLASDEVTELIFGQTRPLIDPPRAAWPLAAR